MNRKLVVFVPADALDAVRDAVFAAGAGRIGDYERCSWYTDGTGTFRPLPGASQSNHFRSYVIADPDGRSADDATRDILTQLCDHTMHLSDFEPVLAALKQSM